MCELLGTPGLVVVDVLDDPGCRPSVVYYLDAVFPHHVVGLGGSSLPDMILARLAVSVVTLDRMNFAPS